ncbi:MAG: hypoxanthine phosphoribosyltransferase [Candidatus Omnitrophota bacterium]
MTPPIKEILISRAELQQRVAALAEEIDRAYAGEELVLISVLKGSIVFLSDLMKELHLDVEIGFLYLSSYRGKTSPQGGVQEYLLPFPEIAGRHALLVEDILDTGASLAYAWDRCLAKHPRSLKTCVLLVKEGAEKEGVPKADFRGFDIPNVFVVGYGLDYKEKYRQLPCIAVPDMGK